MSDTDKLVDFRKEYKDMMKGYDDDTQFSSLLNILKSGNTSISMNRVLMQRIIDSSWVEAIELGILHLDNVLRTPRKTIEDIEEIVPIALSRKISVESVKHLGQHTDLIQSVDPITGKIIPSKILNVYKEESLNTYENKFINTLIERLLVFINVRYDKLSEISKDYESFKIDFSTSVEDDFLGKTKVQIKIENEHDLSDSSDGNGNTFLRVKKLKKIIESYKESDLCKALGNTYIRPPVMRTNAIMKNVDLKACLTLWQYIEGYDKIGYEMNIEDSAMAPDDEYINDFYELIGLHIMLFRSSSSSEQETLEVRQLDPITPRIVKQFSPSVGLYDYSVFGGYGLPGEGGSIAAVQESTGMDPIEIEEIARQIGLVIEIEKAFRTEEAERKLAEQREREERERLEREEEERRIQAARTEKERIELERKRNERLKLENMKQEELERLRKEEEEKRQAQLQETQRKEAIEKARQEAAYRKKKAQEEKERREREIAKQRALRRIEIINDRKRFHRRLAEIERRLRIEIAEQEELQRRQIAFQNQGIIETLTASMSQEELETIGAAAEAKKKQTQMQAQARVQAQARAKAMAQIKNSILNPTQAQPQNQPNPKSPNDRPGQPRQRPPGVPPQGKAPGQPQKPPAQGKAPGQPQKPPAQGERARSAPGAKVAEIRRQRQEEAQEAARRARFLQQRREKAHAAAMRAKQLNTYRKYYEIKDVKEIYREYSYNIIWVLVRLYIHILVKVFGIIPEYSDRPDYIRLRIKKFKEAEQRRLQAESRAAMERFYLIYAQTHKYRSIRKKQDQQREKERIKKLHSEPKREEPKLTNEERKKKEKELHAIYRKYHVSLITRLSERIEEEKDLLNPRYIGGKRLYNINLKPIVNITLTALLVISIGLSIFVTWSTVTGNIVNIAGYSVLKVETGSMEPALHVGDFIIVKRCKPKDIEVHDIVSYYSKDTETYGMLITHRVEKINSDGTFIVRGDANPVSDSLPVSDSQILGVFVRKSKFYLWLGSFADTNKLFLMFVMLPLTLVSIYELRSMISLGKQAHVESNSKAAQRAKAEYNRKMRAAIEKEKRRLAAENYRPGQDKTNEGEVKKK